MDVLHNTANEEKRLAALYRYNILDTPAEEAFDRITNLAKTALDVSISLITLIDQDRQWFKSRQGTKIIETSRDISFCSHTIEGDEPLLVPNLRKDARFAQNPYVAGLPFLRFYCGVPLRTKDGFNIGSLCVLGVQPRKISKEELVIMKDLAYLALEEIELRHISKIDYLTGLATHSVLRIEGEKEIVRAGLGTLSPALIVFEVGSLKQIGQKYGQVVADSVIRYIADSCKPLVAEQHVFSRIGNQFAILMRNTSREDVNKLANKITSVIGDMKVPCAARLIKVSCGLSVAIYEPGDDTFISVENRAQNSIRQNLQDNPSGPVTWEIGGEPHADYSYDSVPANPAY